MQSELHRIGKNARIGLAYSQAELDETVRKLRGMIGDARGKQDQRQWL